MTATEVAAAQEDVVVLLVGSELVVVAVPLPVVVVVVAVPVPEVGVMLGGQDVVGAVE